LKCWEKGRPRKTWRDTMRHDLEILVVCEKNDNESKEMN